jgi:ADP-ribosylglycohydrolase
MSKRIRDKVLGSIAAAAIGDAMGTPVEFLHHRAIKKYFGEIRNIFDSARFSDDTLLRVLTYRAIIEKGGRIDAWDLAAKWKEQVIPNDDYWVTELFISAQLSMGVSPRESGFHNINADDAAMAIDPIGVVNCCDPRNAAMDARDIAAVSQKGTEVEAAIAVAAAVAEAFQPGATVEDVVEMARRFAGPLVSRKIGRAVEITNTSASSSRIYDRLYDEIAVQDGSDSIVRTWRARDPKISGYATEEISLGVSATEFVPVALAFFLASEGDPFETIKRCAGYGRDSDTVAGIGGAVAGAFSGATAINPDLIRRVEADNKVSLSALTEEMIIPIRNAAAGSADSAKRVKKLLAED